MGLLRLLQQEEDKEHVGHSAGSVLPMRNEISRQGSGGTVSYVGRKSQVRVAQHEGAHDRFDAKARGITADAVSEY